MHGIILYSMLPLTILASYSFIIGTLLWTLFSFQLLETERDGYCQLATDVLKNYMKDVRPICEGTAVVVYIDVALRQIQEVSEKSQILSTNAWLRFGWNDCNLSWNESQYDEITRIYLPEEKIWLPDICLYDNAEYMLRGLNEYYRVQINSSGFVQYNFPSKVLSSCTLNIRYFPFDVQTCNLTFGSWSYNDLEVTVRNTRTIGDRANFLTNGEWELVDFSVTRNAVRYPCCKEPFSTVVFQMKIRRKPAIHLLNLVFPSIFVSAIGLLGFFIPSESGEKISISVTVLLSLAVFHLVISETLPHDSDSLPYLGYFFLANMMFVGFCCTMSIIVLNIHYTKAGNSRVIRIIRYLKAKRNSMKIVDTATYDVTSVPSKHMTTTETQTNEEYVQAIKREKQQCPHRSDCATQKEYLFKELLHEMENSFSGKRRAEEVKAEITTVENYVNRFFTIIAIVLFLILSLMIMNLS